MSIDRTITIAICTRNRAHSLRSALHGVGRLRRPRGWDIQVLVVDNGSTDQTADMVQSCGRRLPYPLMRVWEPTPGVAFARNCAMQSASGDWLAFLDDDEVPRPGWLSGLLSCAQRRRVRGVGGSVCVRFLGEEHPALGPFCRRLFGDTTSQLHERPFDRGFQPGAGNLLIHRSLWHIPFVIPFTCDRAAATRGEDSRWFASCQRRGEAVWYTPTAVVDHWIPPVRTAPRACASSAVNRRKERTWSGMLGAAGRH